MSIKELIKKHEIWVFLVLGPVLNVFFVIARTQGLMSSSIYVTGRFCFLLFILVCLLKFTRGNKGIINLFKPMLSWKVHPKWYFLGLIFPVTIAIITLVLKAFYYDLEYSSFINFMTTTFRGYIANLVWAFIGEVVWVSYCMRELSKITKPFYAGQIVAVFWGLWLVPIILLGEGIFPNIPIISAFIFRFGVAGMCAFIYYRTKSSICVLALQYALSLTLLSLPITPRTGGAPTYTVFGVIYFLTMLMIWYIENLANKKKSRVLGP
jgi:membrane protease YdiL (CAAX protease family)